MLQQGIQPFIAEQPQTFRRRVRRGIPVECRWEVWKAAVRMEEHARPGLYQELIPVTNQWTRLIEIDIPRTFPEMMFFDKEQQQSLLRILHAYANFNPDVGYCQGMNFVAGLLLLVSQNGDFRETPRLEKEEETFWMFVCLMEHGTLSGFYRKRFPLLRRYFWAFDRLVAEILPDLQKHFLQENVQHAVYLHQWFLTLFINCVPLPMVLLFWDSIVCVGLEMILPITVSLLKVLKDVLLSMQFEDIVRFFKMMRAGGEKEFDAAAIGQLVVAKGVGIGLPAHIAMRLRAPLPPAEPRGDDRSPTSPYEDDLITPRPPREPDAAAASMDGAGAPSTLLGTYLRQFGDLGPHLPQGVLSWWEDARDNLRAGLGGAESRW